MVIFVQIKITLHFKHYINDIQMWPNVVRDFVK